MTLRHLEIFKAVCEESNMTRAAERLHMTQPAVTRAIHELENHYGVILFDRIYHRLTLTEEGKILYARAIHITEHFSLAEKELRNPDAVKTIRIGASITLGNYFMPAFISAFQQKHENTRLYVKVARGHTLVDLLRANSLDLAFIETYISDPDMVSRVFSTNEMVLVLRKDHPLTRREHIKLADVVSWPLLLRQPGSVGRDHVDAVLKANGYECDPLWESASSQALLRAVKAGHGIAILPDQLVHDTEDKYDLAIRKIEDVSMVRKNTIVYHKNKYLSPLLKELIADCPKENGDGSLFQ